MQNFENHPLHPGESVPTFISAGVIKEPAQLEQFFDIEDVRIVPLIELGGYTWDKWGGNAKAGEQDFVYYQDRKMAGNCRGLPNEGRDGILSLEEPIRRLNERGIKTVIQVTNLPTERPIDVIPDLVELAASLNPTAVEINLSCPNGKNPITGELEKPLSSNAQASGEVMQASRERVGPNVTLGAKDSPHVASLDSPMAVEEITDLGMAIVRYIDFIVGINTIGGQEFPELLCGGGKGGMSGPVVASIAKEHLQIWQEIAPRIPYLSTGGVDSENASSEIRERLEMGALRVGGAQEFYRATKLSRLASEWAIAAA